MKINNRKVKCNLEIEVEGSGCITVIEINDKINVNANLDTHPWLVILLKEVGDKIFKAISAYEVNSL